MKIEYIGKTLLIEHEKQKILVVGDLHLGFEESLRESGVMLPLNIFKEVISDFDKIFERVGGVDKVILLGDIKHEFIKFRQEAIGEIGEVFNYLRRKAKEVVIVKGNHDVVIDSLVSYIERVDLVDYYFIGDAVFLHGDKDFPEIHDKSVRTWIVGHGHPAITLYEDQGAKKEKYKCFLVGKYKNKKIIVVPSFFDVNIGTDPRDFNMGFGWDFKLGGFDVKIVQDESLKVLDFGKLKKI